MSTISSVTTPAVTTPTAPTAATKPAEPAAPTTPAATNTVDAFQKAAEKAPVDIKPAVEDDWAECEFDNTKSGGGGIAAIDPNNGRVVRG